MATLYLSYLSTENVLAKKLNFTFYLILMNLNLKNLCVYLVNYWAAQLWSMDCIRFRSALALATIVHPIVCHWL